MKLYYHKTSGGAEYLTDKCIICASGHKEGIFEDAEYVVRIDGDITKDAELTVTSNNKLLEACKLVVLLLDGVPKLRDEIINYDGMQVLKAAIAAAEGGK